MKCDEQIEIGMWVRNPDDDGWVRVHWPNDEGIHYTVAEVEATARKRRSPLMDDVKARQLAALAPGR